MREIWTVLPFSTKIALCTSHHRSDDYSVASLEVLHFSSDFFDDADAFVAKRAAYLCGGNFAANDVQVCATDRRPEHADDSLVRVLDLRDRFVHDGGLAGASVDESFHFGGVGLCGSIRS
jgi:hypothetical protein